jgi:hypothetical protein
MSFKLLRETISLYEEEQILESIALFENVAVAMQPYVAILNTSVDSADSPFDPNNKKVKKPIPADGFAAFLSGLKVLSDRETRRNAYAEDFGSTQKDFEFISSIGKSAKSFGEDGNKTAQQRVMDIGRQAKNIYNEFKDKIGNWADEKIRKAFIAEVKKLVTDWDRQTNAIKTEYNKLKLK